MSGSKKDAAIQLRGVRHNNLKNFDLDLPIGRLIVVTGLSGSGKSSLAFDTLYAEGQRRYIETFSPYARQFFDRMDKPQVDSIEGIPPAIAIEQRNTVRSTRSTVGTMTEICDHMKVLWPHIAKLHCRNCSQPVQRESTQFIWNNLKSSQTTEKLEILITFNLPLSNQLSLPESLALIAKQGYQRLLIKGEVRRIDSPNIESAFGKYASEVTVVQDRIKIQPNNRRRFIEACEQAYHFGKGKVTIHPIAPDSTHHAPRKTAPLHYSHHLHCARCDLDYRDPSPALFSFNHPLGACSECRGFGRIITIDYNLAIPDRTKTLASGAVKPWQTGVSAECQRDMMKFCRATKIPTRVPFNQLSEANQRWVIDGDPDYGIDEEHEWPRAWYGIKGYFRWLESKAYKMHVRVQLSRYRIYTQCPKCRGARLNPDALLYLLTQNAKRITLADFYNLPVSEALDLTGQLIKRSLGGKSKTGNRNSEIEHVFQEVHSRLRYLNDIGLGYLTLDRQTRTLSGGETERVNLAACLGTRLVQTLFVLDEPSVGLHPRDTDRLVTILQNLRNVGNTVIVVEHERSVMEAADQIVDLGPGHGATGGKLVFQGTHRRILKSNSSLTGKYLSGKTNIEIPERRPVNVGQASSLSSKRIKQDSLEGCPTLKVTNATQHNLKNLSVEIPLNRFVCLSGVSGSGKSTLVRDILLPALQHQLGVTSDTPKASDRLSNKESDESGSSEYKSTDTVHLTGAEHLTDVVLVDQSSLGKTPRSNPAVYTGAFDHIREVFAQTEDARQQGLSASAFSFNSAQGQCERCRGAGYEKVEMQFLSDVFIKCPDCNGRRYRDHILKVRVRKPEVSNQHQEDTTSVLSIADVLESTVDEAIGFLDGFADSKHAQRAIASLRLLQEVGLGYLHLGQPINTLSGGESQRLKLVKHLANASQRSAGNGATLFLLDEPTTGLHFDDVRVLLAALQRLVNAGHSLIVIEHNLDVLKCADWIIDLGPGAGANGGQLVAAGTPERIAACKVSHTGSALAKALRKQQKRTPKRKTSRA